MTHPRHYEGWKCTECQYIKVDRDWDWTCNAPDFDHSMSISNMYETPNWCPYIRDAIITRNVEES